MAVSFFTTDPFPVEQSGKLLKLLFLLLMQAPCSYMRDTLLPARTNVILLTVVIKKLLPRLLARSVQTHLTVDGAQPPSERKLAWYAKLLIWVPTSK